MVFISARFLSLLLTALAAGVVFSHVMSRAGKIALPGPIFVTVQNTLYRGWGKKVGVVEIGAFLSTLIVVFLARGKGPIFAFSLAGLLCLMGMMLLWAVFINPINLRVRASTSECLPADWALLRDRWHRLHPIRAIFAIIGLSTLISPSFWIAPGNWSSRTGVQLMPEGGHRGLPGSAGCVLADCW